LMGSVDAVWLYVFVMDFLNSLAREKSPDRDFEERILKTLCKFCELSDPPRARGIQN
jgi:hypothetical protein